MEVLEIMLEDTAGLVLRGLTGETSEDAVLHGFLQLSVSTEPITIKEIQLLFIGTAKVCYRDTSNHHYDHPLICNEFSFLNPSPTSRSHSQVLASGIHRFPFSIVVSGLLPASLRTYSGSCLIEYKLKAIVTRPGFAADWKAKKIIRINRGFAPDAVEYNQTLEIENTWPGKVMYAFTIPYKAYAAGEIIPVSVKFSPISKGVKILSLVTTIREHSTVHTKASSHSESRDTTTTKYSFVTEGGENSHPNTSPPSRVASSASLSSMNYASGATTPAIGDFYHSPSNGEQAVASGSGSSHSSSHLNADRSGEDVVDDGIDVEIDVVVDVRVPLATLSSHSVYPAFISHKLKWSAFIRNPDGHVSELRCALPIHILDVSLSEEARLASAGSRNLLFGESGVLAVSSVEQVDLPSYQDHTMDRVANAETSSYFSHSSFLPTARGSRTTPASTPDANTHWASPPHTRPPSPSGIGIRNLAPTLIPTPLGSPDSPAIENEQDHRNWIDSELMGTLNLDMSPNGSNPSSQPNSRPSSRPSSRPGSPTMNSRLNSQANSRPNSRPGSPNHSPPILPNSSSASGPLSSSWSTGHAFPEPPPLAHRNSFFNISMPRPLRPLTAFSRTASSSSVNTTNNAPPSASALSHALANHAAKSQRHSGDYNIIHTHSTLNSPSLPSSSHAGSPIVSTSFLTHNPGLSLTPLANSEIATTPEAIEEGGELEPGEEIDFLSQVPSYDVARRGFLGGGVTPLSSTAPSYTPEAIDTPPLELLTHSS